MCVSRHARDTHGAIVLVLTKHHSFEAENTTLWVKIGSFRKRATDYRSFFSVKWSIQIRHFVGRRHPVLGSVCVSTRTRYTHTCVCVCVCFVCMYIYIYIHT